MSTKPWKSKTHIHLDRQSRTEKEYTLLALIFAANQSMVSIKNNSKYKNIIRNMNIEEMLNDSSVDKTLSAEIRDNYHNNVIKRLKYSLELFKSNGAGTYGDVESKIEDQFYRTYTPALEFGIFINSELDLSENAKRVANGEITIREYIDETYFNFICVVNNETVHIIYEILVSMKENNNKTISKEQLSFIFGEKIDSDGIKTVMEWMASGTIFIREQDELIINQKYSIEELILRCNLMYYKKSLEEIKNSNLHNQEYYASYVSGSVKKNNDKIEKLEYVKCSRIDKPNNRIIFGAPGTGKSHLIEEDRKKYFGNNYERVTFHPSYTYAQFVGTYKPRSKKVQAGSEDKKEISYEYVPGPFLRVLTKALKSIKDGGEIENYVLIIEEINRANPAAVFGDTFQLLDRKDGESEYEISVNEDMKDYLRDKLEEEYETIKIPANMYIWATMNSADQGVYPMDTAFKRRWNFEYIDIDNGQADNDAIVKLKDGKRFKWNDLRKEINEKLEKVPSVDEDKFIGPFFLNKDNLNDKNFDSCFKSKLLMYLYQDVLRHKKNDLFKGNFTSFSKLLKAYDKDGMDIFDFKLSYIEDEEKSVAPKENVPDSEN